MTGLNTQTDCTPGLDHSRELVRCPGDHGAPSALKRLMVENREDLCDGLKKDLGKSELEGWLTAKPLPRSPAVPGNPRRPPRDPQDPGRPMGTLKFSRSGVVHGKRSDFFSRLACYPTTQRVIRCPWVLGGGVQPGGGGGAALRGQPRGVGQTGAQGHQPPEPARRPGGGMCPSRHTPPHTRSFTVGFATAADCHRG